MFRRVAGTFVATAVVLALTSCGGAKSPVSTAPNLPTAPLQTVQQLVDTIISGTFAVAPRTFKPIEFIVDATMSNPRIEGTFTAKGANNDIEVLLLDEQQFANWQNRHPFKSTYASGRVTADKLRISLPAEAGKYFMVFSNRFSIISSKDVVTDLKLRYDRAF